MNLADTVRPSADRGGDTAFVDLGAGSTRSWTAGDFDLAIDHVATMLAAQSYEAGSRVALLGRNSAEMLQSYFGVMRAGLVAVPVNTRLGPDGIRAILSDSRPAAAFADDEYRQLLPASLPTFPFGSETQVGSQFRPPVLLEEAIAKILYTSGSTGQPKGVMLGHLGQSWAIRHSANGRRQGGVTMVAAPFYHKNGLYNATMALAEGMTVVSLPRFTAPDYLRAAADYRATVLTGIPTMFALMAREAALIDQLDLSCVQQVNVGSAPLGDALAQRIAEMFPGADLTNGYGTTEVGPIVFGTHPAGIERPATSLGVPDPSIEWRLGGDGDEGVLEVRTPAMMAGYFGLPDQTAARLRNGWYNTGDIMRRDQQGFFYFVGRADDMFVCGGENIFPADVEALLERHPAVAQVAVVPAPDDIKGQVPVAFVVAKPDAAVSADALKHYALSHGPAYAHPRAVLFRDALPTATTHKIDRRALMVEAAAARAGASAAVQA